MVLRGRVPCARRKAFHDLSSVLRRARGAESAESENSVLPTHFGPGGYRSRLPVSFRCVERKPPPFQPPEQSWHLIGRQSGLLHNTATVSRKRMIDEFTVIGRYVHRMPPHDGLIQKDGQLVTIRMRRVLVRI
jgi:hypothetical protein